MATIQIRDIPEDAYEVIRKRARAAGRSIQSYMRDWVVEFAGHPTTDEEGYSASLVTIYTRKCMSPLGVSPRAAARLLQESGLP